MAVDGEGEVARGGVSEFVVGLDGVLRGVALRLRVVVDRHDDVGLDGIDHRDANLEIVGGGGIGTGEKVPLGRAREIGFRAGFTEKAP